MRKLRIMSGVLALFWMCVIFAFSAQKKEESGAVSQGFSYRVVSSTTHLFHLNLDEERMREIANAIEGKVRKAAHMAEYAILSILIYVWLGLWQQPWWKKSLTVFCIAIPYAASDELHQLFVPGRAGKISDVLIDSAGAVLGLFLFLGVKRCISFLWSRHKYRKTKLS